MYIFNKEYKDKLLSGKKINWVANELEISYSYLSQILNGTKSCSKMCAWGIISFFGYDMSAFTLFYRKEYCEE